MILQALEITNNTDPQNPITELITETTLPWTDELLDGNEPIIVGLSVTAGYQDISSIENWSKWGIYAVGKFTAFKDWKCLRSEIKALALSITNNDLGTNWSSLSSDEQQIVCRYLPNLVPAAKFVATFPDDLERTQISLNFDQKSTNSREQRYTFMRMYLLGKVGVDNGIKFFDDCVRDGRVEAYRGGVEDKETDGVDALKDMIDATDGTRYDGNQTVDELKGLRNRAYQIVDGSGDTLTEVCDTLINIANGIY